MTKTNKRSSIKKLSNKVIIYIMMPIIILGAGSIIGYQFNNWQSAYESSPNLIREKRIKAIYSGLNLGNEYVLQNSDVFGDKRIYEWDSGRSYSSVQTYLRGANVDVTAADLRQKIETSGFSFFDEPYPGGAGVQLHFKSKDSEYIRMSVDSKPRNDAFQNAYLMTSSVPDSVANMDWNMGPSSITIKVNLDDNNE